ncbi:DUF1761 domain-containing protein [Microbacterium phyllosphaerae]|uniref:DUF1761 domain-containing protein n=1 Tax=Microbacterium phyllosphaerae TaxID=124798 RepID=UPI0021686370|nr:DUF1761 domain-containing protein [Microbacterium phyllosphaerae]MCS3442195.1 hypothetical protein [Microbacterium phyllosphaerae]
MEILVNWWAVVTAVAASMVIGAIWYARPVFGDYWMRAAKVDPTEGAPAVALSLTALLAGITATGIAVGAHVAWTAFGGSFLLLSLTVAGVAWVSFTAARMTTHYLFENRAAGLMLVNAANEAVTLAGMAVVIGVWAPAGLS